MTRDKHLLVHLGSAVVAPAAWVNVDGSWNALISRLPSAFERPLRSVLGRVLGDTLRVHWPANIVVRDVRRPLPFVDETVAVVYASHLIEHLDPVAAGALLRECRRVLVRDGLLRVVTPDLECLARRYLAQKLSSPTAGDDFVRSWNIFHSDPSSSPLRWYRRLRPFHTHKWLYDTESLGALLDSLAFREIRRCTYLESAIPLERLSEVEQQSRFADALCLEASK